ncbi:TPA: hypothetical protein QC364_000692 [Bacillus cereus]|uniref:hypothetical protein n=1 Tax=Bacillus paranthracis TaxID=2026186 RepID=UPI002D7657DB|nr:hypothetical protein [Bacillus paranthracis]HDR8453902.1 hypothetical protein [Bacillus cereus]
MGLSTDLGVKLFGNVSTLLVIVGFIYGGWKVYHSRFYRESLESEFRGGGYSAGFNLFIAIILFLVYTFVFAVVTVLLPLIALYIIWGVLFGF